MIKADEIKWIKEYVGDYRHKDSDIPGHAEKCIDLLYRLVFEDIKDWLHDCSIDIDCYIDDQYPASAHRQFEKKNEFLKRINPARIALIRLEGDSND